MRVQKAGGGLAAGSEGGEGGAAVPARMLRCRKPDVCRVLVRAGRAVRTRHEYAIGAAALHAHAFRHGPRLEQEFVIGSCIMEKAVVSTKVVNSVIASLAVPPSDAAPGALAGAGTVADLGYFAVGFAPMDAIHREFHGLLGALAEPGDQGEKLLALHEHLLRHCSQEERWMIDSDFAASVQHAREHETLLEVVSEVRRRFDAGDSDIVQSLAQELPRWFEHHANNMDAALAVHLRELPERGGRQGRAAAPETAEA
jgi:hemerythrin-like metal-binding protein